MRKKLFGKIFGLLETLMAIAILALLWWALPGLLNDGFDMNLSLIRWLGDTIPSYGQHIEAFLRFFSAEKVLLVFEVTFIIGLILTLLGRMFRSKKI